MEKDVNVFKPRIAIIDTETTGLTLPSSAELSKQSRIIELGIVVVEGGKSIGEYNWLINPGNLPLSSEITKITGIKTEDLEDKLTFAQQLHYIKLAFEGCTHLVAHNAPFDTALLRFDLLRCECDDFPWPAIQICTVQEYRHAFGHRPKLVDLYQQKLGKPLAQTHRAIDDAKALFEILAADNFFQYL